MKLALQIEKVTKTYQHKSRIIKILSEVNLELVSGKSISIVGPSGSGKSTLLALIGGLEPIDSGTITVLQKNIAHLSAKELRELRGQKLGFVFQQFHLLDHLTALENIALPALLAKDANCYQKAERLLSDIDLSSRKDHMPTELSGGECQRVAIARALINEPPLLLADEPSGNLDHKTGFEVMDLLFNLVKQAKTSLVLVTHNEQLAKKCMLTCRVKDQNLQII